MAVNAARPPLPRRFGCNLGLLRLVEDVVYLAGCELVSVERGHDCIVSTGLSARAITKRVG